MIWLPLETQQQQEPPHGAATPPAGNGTAGDSGNDGQQFTVSVGNRKGVFFQYKTSNTNSPASHFCHPYLQFSASKFVTAAAIGYAMEKLPDRFSRKWDTPASAIINWWTGNAEDTRSSVTLKSLLSLQSGFNTAGHAGKSTATCGGDTRKWTYKSCAQHIYRELYCPEQAAAERAKAKAAAAADCSAGTVPLAVGAISMISPVFPPDDSS